MIIAEAGMGEVGAAGGLGPQAEVPGICPEGAASAVTMEKQVQFHGESPLKCLCRVIFFVVVERWRPWTSVQYR